MLAESQFRPILIPTMSNSDGNDVKLKNSPKPTSIPPIGSPVSSSISKTPNLENQVSVSRSREEVKIRRRTGDEADDGLKNSPLPSSYSPIRSPITTLISNTPNLENQGSVSLSTEQPKKRRHFEEHNDDGIKNSLSPISISPIGSPISASISNTPNLENLGSVSGSTERTKRRRLGEEIDENDDGFRTPTDSDHRIRLPTKCPPAPRKPSSRKSKSPPAMAAAMRRSIFPVDVSDEEAESMFPPHVED